MANALAKAMAKALAKSLAQAPANALAKALQGPEGPCEALKGVPMLKTRKPRKTYEGKGGPSRESPC